MQMLTPFGQQVVSDYCHRYGLSQDAVIAMIQSVIQGNGSMAQFNIPELGGSGQWMQGGMTMVGDMFNYGLQNTVANLCGEISSLLASSGSDLFERPKGWQQGGHSMNPGWWPADLGMPASSGSQNQVRYAIFPHCARLAIDNGGQITVYDTLNHQIGGVGQQQGATYGLSFSSQFGNVDLNQLPVVSGPGHQTVQWNSPSAPIQPEESAASQDIYQAIEQLASLRDRGILTDDEFNNKKTELLARL